MACKIVSVSFSAPPLCCYAPQTSLKQPTFQLPAAQTQIEAYFLWMPNVEYTGQIAICNNVAFAYPELLQLTWISHDLLAFCPDNGRIMNYNTSLRSTGLCLPTTNVV
ncbi:hypothetical protein JRO89_XS03G0317600 [Xanthoceras sorbifolium]|uniref:Uncharacterized protein n=1 Tax=Xanthoceras sorbifolium TaxID=99658 RepID=A0ABQ8ID22_9ROSI|nr:hypothetical protein JRO89_XS03G0317600 [Xanthoceras sorbifolium]